MVVYCLPTGLIYHMSFFFFQAEDGIRDYKVTGVQTCALPIFGPVVGDVNPGRTVLGLGLQLRNLERLSRPRQDVQVLAGDGRPVQLRDNEAVARSEERRVGKEGRSRWVPYH